MSAIEVLKHLLDKAEAETQPDYKTDHGYMWLCPHCGLPVHSDFEECLRCGTKRQSAQPEIIRCKDCKFSDEFDGDVWLCRRRKESFRVLAIDTCNYAERRTDE